MMPDKPLFSLLSILLLCIFISCALSFLSLFLSPIITANESAVRTASAFSLFPGAASLENPRELSSSSVFVVRDPSGRLLGYITEVLSETPLSSDIHVLVGINPDLSVSSVQTPFADIRGPAGEPLSLENSFIGKTSAHIPPPARDYFSIAIFNAVNIALNSTAQVQKEAD